MDTIKRKYGNVTSENGFYIGDPCWVLSDEVYHDIWGDNYFFKDGIIETKNGNFIVQSTFYGDGNFNSSIGNLRVESGTIAIIPTKLIDEKKVKELNSINDVGALVPGTEAELIWLGTEANKYKPFEHVVGEFVINLKNPDYSVKIPIGEVIKNDESGVRKGL